jgi:hypothetical protein
MPPKKAPRVWAMESAKRILAGMEEVRPRAAMGLAVSPLCVAGRACGTSSTEGERTHARERASAQERARACMLA